MGKYTDKFSNPCGYGVDKEADSEELYGAVVILEKALTNAKNKIRRRNILVTDLRGRFGKLEAKIVLANEGIQRYKNDLINVLEGNLRPKEYQALCKSLGL